MFKEYFTDLEKSIKKLYNQTPEKAAKAVKGAKAVKSAEKPKAVKSAKAKSNTTEELAAIFNDLVPGNINVATLKTIDINEYVPEGIDFLAYSTFFKNIEKMAGGVIPAELVSGTYHVVENLSRDTLIEALSRVMNAKKVNKFSVDSESEKFIPSFIVAVDSDLKLPLIKDNVLDYYVNRGIDFKLEVDIIVVLGKGILIKDWSEKRSFKGLETGKDTLMWFCVLMNEFLEIEPHSNFDLRNYIKTEEPYKEC